MANKKRFTESQIEAALRASGGIYTIAAVKLSCAPNTVKNYVQDSKALQDVEIAIVQENVDFAEAELLKKIREGNMTAIIFYLKTKGKDRGYTERTEMTGKNGGPIEHAYDTDHLDKLTDAQLASLYSQKVGAGRQSVH